jgi:hypothetical protein
MKGKQLLDDLVEGKSRVELKLEGDYTSVGLYGGLKRDSRGWYVIVDMLPYDVTHIKEIKKARGVGS